MAPARRTGEAPSGSQGPTPTPRTKQRPPPPPFYLPLNIALYLCIITNVISALYAPIQDCDEVFNFWEPTHYLNHGYGLQTWEYSPVYSIRSWLYVSTHALVGKIGSFALSSKSAEFYAIRCFLALVCAACETRLYSAICRTLSPRIGLLFLMVVAFTPGMFHASTAFLPSSFTMYMSMLGLTAFLDWRDGQKTAQGIMWFGLGAIVGWPFAGALMLPLLLEEVVIGLLSSNVRGMFLSVLDGAMRCLVILALEIAVDYAFLRKLVIVPWNIVAYNVFGGEGRGPDIFGVEPWTFYIRNLLLNFNIWFAFAMAAAPLLALQALFRPKATSVQTLLRTVTLITPFYMWFAIFTAQPHKEERFMFPAYPFLALNASIAFHMILSFVGSSNPNVSAGSMLPKIKLAVIMSIILMALNSGLLRIVGIMSAYNAPLKVFEPLAQPGVAQPGDTVCFGKEWYRFPSSFFLPSDLRAKFVRSEFRGLLPGEFPEAADFSALFEGTSRIPTGMNDRNEEDLGKYTDLSQCSFLVDSEFPSRKATELEPDYIHEDTQWEQLACHSFLDASQTGLLGRLIWTPDLPITPEPLRRKWGEYCLLRRRSDLLRAHITDASNVEWIPSDFKRPPASPYPDWDVHTTKPIPYRPFRYGPKYFVTMGLRSMNWDEWIELDNHYLKYHADKARRIAERGDKCCKTAPEAWDAAIELLEELTSYLPERYPTMFQRTPTGLTNLITHETFNITQRPLPEDPMTIAARLIQDDLAIMVERPDGEYYLLAGAVLLAGFWRLSDKYGMRLSEIHTSGSVPQYTEKLEKGMMNFFRRLKPEDPVLRNNYFIQVDDSLPWSHSIGSEDAREVSWSTAQKNKAIENHWFRSERQSLRRLPRSGGVVFTIRTYFEPITKIVEEEYVPGRLASAVRSWGDDVAVYKGRERYGDVLLEFLDRKHQEQLDRGLRVELEDEVRKYPL
ncbi:glycosyltransferase family 22 protein [Aspergillus luchuensis CBS 106.47]|uniref:Mannosyltransferase n=1 Tax=Aspergillus luchuensis (strain CBS 106.47) TaxID=1137211 RepID=A0A1M3TP33_ASPLC|nr:glycosyltransferase family 22 protein [Aspergillus luchuensis CBS 106.47]